MSCNSKKCHCPACTEEKRLAGLEHRVDVLELRESNRDMMAAIDAKHRMREQGDWRRPKLIDEVKLPFDPSARQFASNSRGPVYRGYRFDRDVIWQWAKSKFRSDLWRRKDLKTHLTFGAPWSNRGHPITPWGAPYEKREKVTAVEHTEHKRAGEIETTTTDRVEFEGVEPKFITPEIRIAYPTLRKTMTTPPKYSGPTYDCHIGDMMHGIKGGEGSIGTVRVQDETFSEIDIRAVFNTKAAGGWDDAARYSGARTGRWSSLQHYGCGAEEFLRQARAAYTPKKENPMSPNMIRALMRIYGEEHIPHPMFRPDFDHLVGLGLAAKVNPSKFEITAKGRVMVKAMLALPLPVATEPEWRMPPRS